MKEETIQWQNKVITQQSGFWKNLLGIEKNKYKAKTNKPIYPGLLILQLSKTVIYEFWYDFAKSEYKNEENYVTWIQIPLE